MNKFIISIGLIVLATLSLALGLGSAPATPLMFFGVIAANSVLFAMAMKADQQEPSTVE